MLAKLDKFAIEVLGNEGLQRIEGYAMLKQSSDEIDFFLEATDS